MYACIQTERRFTLRARAGIMRGMPEQNMPVSISELVRIVLNLIRDGKVGAVQAEPPRVRVIIGELITDWLPWYNTRAGAVKTAYQPSVGEQCTVFSPGGNIAAGRVLLGLNSDENPMPECGPNDYIIDVPSGGKILLRAGGATLEITAEQIREAVAGSSITSNNDGVQVKGTRIDLN